MVSRKGIIPRTRPRAAAGPAQQPVNLPHWLTLSADEAAALTLPQGSDQQHARWQWLPLEQAARDASVHAYVRVYAQWLRDNAR